VSGMRSSPNPWLTDRVIFAGYRWLTWGVTAMWLFGQGRLISYGAVLVGTLLLTVLVTVLARQYIRLARHMAASLLLDILLVVAAVVRSGGWESPFIFYASTSLVLPALLFGWRGGVMAGLAFVAVYMASLNAFGEPVSERLFEGLLPGISVPLSMVVPPIFGVLCAVVIERLRHQDAQRRPGHRRYEHDDFEEPFLREPRIDPPRLTRVAREGQPGDRVGAEAPLALTRIRPAEQSVEDLRRLIFAPLPAPDMDLAGIFDVLVVRFGQQTGTPARISTIGRTRPLRATHRALLVRLAQEALLNIQQHAHAASVSLTLRYDVNSVALLIQDNGVGLIDGTHERPGLHALRALRYRLSELGGRLDVFETEGGGVTVRATMPIE
jgi:hypothetical protein